MSEEEISELVAKFEAQRAMDELRRRHPDQDWDMNPKCPDCGSYEHFEC